ncbi:MAG: HDOD domain-containing protein [Nitrospinota bacterium]
MGDDKNRVQEIVKGITNLPTLPPVMMQVLSLMQDPKTTADDIGKVIVSDQALAANILKVVNSAYYGFPRKINTIIQSILILGFDTIKNIILTTSILDIFSDKGEKGGFDRDRFWEHAIACGVATKIIAERIGCVVQEESFLSGLVHDIGKVVLDRFLHDDFKKIVKKVNDENILIIDAERSVLGITHAEIGSWLAEEWNMPHSFSHAIAYHHDPLLAKEDTVMVSIVHVSDILCRAIGAGSGGDKKIPRINREAWMKLKLSMSAIESILKRFDEEMEKASVFIELSRSV